MAELKNPKLAAIGAGDTDAREASVFDRDALATLEALCVLMKLEDLAGNVIGEVGALCFREVAGANGGIFRLFACELAPTFKRLGYGRRDMADSRVGA